MRYIFYVIISSVFLWTGCGDKDTHKQETEDSQAQVETKIQNTFRITDIDQRSTTISIKNAQVKIAKVTQDIVLVNIFSEWSAPSSGMIPYLDSLQKKYPKDLFVIGLVANSDMDNKQLRNFMKKNNASYFISNSHENDKLAGALVKFLNLDSNYPIPLTILFKNGKYSRHYIGATPIEMIRADIEQLKKKG
ncbi:MAG: hypothetical protein HF962_02080 [Sulfurovum sp.]|nr:hypothetical protein [Sulfurovum sp.]